MIPAAGRRVAVVGHVEWVEFVSVARAPGSGEVVHATGAFQRAAGGGAVAASVLAELGAEVDFFCALGRDEQGRMALDQLAARGIHAHVAWREEPTRRAVTLLEPGGERTIVTIGERLEARGGDALEWGLLRDAAGVYFTAGDDGALRAARAATVLVCSPRAHRAFGPARGIGEGVVVDALVFSDHDAAEAAWARPLFAASRLLVATEGTSGGRWWSEHDGGAAGRWSAAPPPGAVRDSYGCGDSFAAGLTFALAEGRPIDEAVELGALCGSRCLTRDGAP
ncbi:MAG: ribokinase [Acidobacteriota bacterium]|nr:ribokinase [Acidobacteriota bacterium]